MATNGVYIIEDPNDFLKVMEELQKQYLEHAKEGVKDNDK